MNIAGEDAEGEVVYFGFAEQVEAARNGWLQGRYYSEEGDTVADVLSFRSVFEINPFVVGASYTRERRVGPSPRSRTARCGACSSRARC